MSEAFVDKILPVFCAANYMVRIAMNLPDTELESSEAYLLKFRRNLSSGFKFMDIFGKK